MNQPETTGRFYRCAVPSDAAKATLQIARTKIQANLQEQSIDGFTLTINAEKAAKLRLGKSWILTTKDDRVEVHPEWMFHASNGDVQMGLRRLKDLNEIESRPSRWNPFASRIMTRRRSQSAANEIAFAGMIVFVFAVLSLPGLGDAVGTAPRIQEAAGEVGQMAGKVLRSLW